MWIIWTFLPTLTWAGWIHAGIRAKHSKYFMIAVLYGISFMLAMIFSEDKKSPNGEYSATYNVIKSLNMLVWIGGIIHAQVVKKEVNLRIKYAGHASSGLSSADGELERSIAAEYGVQALPSNAPPVSRASLQQPVSRIKPRPPVAPKLSEGQADSSGIDVNNASEQDIAALPGIGPILAKKAIKIRQSQGGFKSIEQFAQALGLKPHVVEQIRSRVLIGPSVESPGVVKKASGRVVDF